MKKKFILFSPWLLKSPVTEQFRKPQLPYPWAEGHQTLPGGSYPTPVLGYLVLWLGSIINK